MSNETTSTDTQEAVVETTIGQPQETIVNEAIATVETIETNVVDQPVAVVVVPEPAVASQEVTAQPNSNGHQPRKQQQPKHKGRPQQHQHQSKKQPRPVVLVESGQVHSGKVAGFAMSSDKVTRTGVVLRFKGGDSAFMHSSQIGGHFPESRLNMMQVGDLVNVEVQVVAGEKRKVKASEKLLFLDDVAKQLESGLSAQQGEVVNKSNIGAFVKITTPGAAFGFVGLLHFNSIPGGQRGLAALNVGKPIEVDISRARVDRERGVLKLTLDAFGSQRREIENRFPAGISVTVNVFKDNGDHYLMALKSGERCVLPKSLLNGFNADALKQGKSTSAFVTGVDARGIILLSKVMPE